MRLGPLGFDASIPGWRAAWIANPEVNIIELAQDSQDQSPVPPPIER